MKHTALLRGAAIAALVALPLAAAAAPKSFAAPSGWEKTASHSGTGRSTESFKKGDQLLTILSDEGLSYDSTVDAVKKNISGNGIKANMDKDLTCGGKKAHEFEMTLGITVYHQLLINENPGITKVTYARSQDDKPASEALAAITGYCS